MSRRGSPWSHSVFANWLRRINGLPPVLDCGTSEEWDAWEQQEKSKAPLLHWFLEGFIDRLQDAVEWPARRLDNVRWYMHNRFHTRTHMLPTGVKPGEWADLDHRLLHANMQALVDFVEVEVAWLQYYSYSSEFARRYGCQPRWWRVFRCAQAGIDHLEWAATLDQPDTETPSPQQASKAREVLAIYRWWKLARPNRADPDQASGLAALYEAHPMPTKEFCEAGLNRTPEWLAAFQKSNEIEQNYHDEDDAMLIRLMKVRKGLWT